MMLTTLGLMSGTSLDGVDLAMIETDGRTVRKFGPSGYRPYSERERACCARRWPKPCTCRSVTRGPASCVRPSRPLRPRMPRRSPPSSRRIASRREDIDIVGFHGQTVLHRPAKKMTVQIGDGAALAKAIHIPVMHDFRAADVEAGGQGAPFVPVYHRALTQSLEREGPIIVVNIGGVANITYIDGSTR